MAPLVKSRSPFIKTFNPFLNSNLKLTIAPYQNHHAIQPISPTSRSLDKTLFPNCRTCGRPFTSGGRAKSLVGSVSERLTNRKANARNYEDHTNTLAGIFGWLNGSMKATRTQAHLCQNSFSCARPRAIWQPNTVYLTTIQTVRVPA